jgi:Lrp/AsnC family transcriptional regulator for asnA, asnC and gidA
MKLDDTDHRIIAALRQDSRRSIRELAKALGLRPSTVHQRITKLRKEGIIRRFTVKLDNAAVGEGFIVFMLVLGKPTQYVGKTLIDHPHIKEVFGVTGEYDLLFKLKFKDVAEFNDFVIGFRKENKEVQKTLTMVVTVDLKEEL